MPTAVSFFLLACGMLPQVGLAAEQRSLRAGRTSEAIPVITLPESMLLQGSDQEDTSDSSDSVVQNARDEFLSDTTAAPNTTANTTAAATTTAKPTTTAPVAMTTMNISKVVKMLNITTDAAKARNLLVGMIARAQLGLLKRLRDIDVDLDATASRALMDLKAINGSFVAAKNMPIMARNADVDVKKIETKGNNLKATLPTLVNRSTSQVTQIKKFLKLKKELDVGLLKTKKLPGAKRRVQNNQATMKTLIPRLEKLERRVTKLEGRLYDGDLQKLVDDATAKETTSIMEDVSRGFGRFFKSKE